MKIPLSWLNEYVDVKDIPIQDLRFRLDMAGLEVEGIEAIGYPEAELPWDPEKILTAEVLAVRPHPDADRLVLAEVNYGGVENEIVVTGAPSLYERKGESGLHLKVAFAWEGATLYDGHKEGWSKTKLKPTKIRGVPSRAMVCSEKELGLAEEQTDIIYLPDDTPVCVPLVEVLGDYVLDFQIKGPFGHLQSVYGIARDMAAIFHRPLKRTPIEAAQRLGLTVQEQPDFVDLEIADPDLCPRYTATMIRGVEIGPSPLWMQMRLSRAGMRSINNVVDITNYVMLELGQPLHAFDYADIRPRPGQGQPAIIVRRAAEGEQMATLDGELRTYDGEMLLITDGGGPVGIGGVMGGLDSEVKDDTQDILLEAASFNFINIRRTCQTLKLATEAGSRFGKRVDAELALVAAARAAELMVEFAGARVDQVAGDLYPGKPEPRVIHYSPALADRILGLAIPPEEQLRILASLEFRVEDTESLPIPGAPDQGDVWRVTVPSYRLDVSLPVDLVEEIGRIWGYDHFPITLIEEELPPLRRNVSLEEEDHIRDIMVGLGLDEVIVYSLIDPEDEARLNPDPQATLALPGERVMLKNYLSPERSQMRRTLLSGALRTAWSNLRFLERIAIFEVGHIYFKMRELDADAPDTGVDEPRRLCILLTGPRQGRWYAPTDREMMDYFDLKGIADALLRSLALEDKVQWAKGQHPSFHPGRCAAVTVNDRELGVVGELHPLVREAFDLPEQPIVMLEWDLDALLDAARQADAEKKIGTLSIYPPVYEDLALVVDESLPADDVRRAILEAGYPLVTQALFFDVYRGAQVGEGRKSLAFALTYQSPGKPLDERDVAKLRERVIKLVQKRINATLRGA
ncbi:MAG: phenylalanine--tRNA ligase subunit beta [Anaerolineae bacterium]|nr:phenylalanine--tRNA ligase subunit beta [Anaerolineae bacterium]